MSPSTPIPLSHEDLFLPAPGQQGPNRRVIHVLAAVMRIFIMVIRARVSSGDTFRRRLLDASGTISVTQLAALLPVPALVDNLADSAYCSMAFDAALDLPESPFDHSSTASVPPLRRWLARLLKQGRVSPCVYLAVLVYIDRLLLEHPAMILTSANVHRIVAACFVIACKEWEDRPMWMTGFAALTGIPMVELKGLEVAMLKLLDFRTHITVEDFVAAEAAFTAEAMEAGDGFELILHLGRVGVNTGLDDVISHVTSWTQMSSRRLPKDSMARNSPASSMDPSFHPSMTFQGDSVWRPVTRSSDARTWEVKVCSLARCLAEKQFPGIPLQPRPVSKGPMEEKLLRVCGAAGMERLRMLRGILLNFEEGDANAPLPPLDGRAIQCRHIHSGSQRKPRRGLGSSGLFLLDKPWDFALITTAGEDPWQEMVVYGDEDIVIPEGKTKSRPYMTPPPSPFNLNLDDEQIDYPPGFIPISPVPAPEMWNKWWLEHGRAQLERDFADQVQRHIARAAGGNTSPPPSCALVRELWLGHSGGSTRSNAISRYPVTAPERPNANPVVPPGFTPPALQPMRASAASVRLLKRKNLKRPRRSAPVRSWNDRWESNPGEGLSEDSLALTALAGVSGHGIWADLPSVKVVSSPQSLERRPQQESLALWRAQDVSAAVALNALQEEEALDAHRSDWPLGPKPWFEAVGSSSLLDELDTTRAAGHCSSDSLPGQRQYDRADPDGKPCGPANDKDASPSPRQQLRVELPEVGDIDVTDSHEEGSRSEEAGCLVNAWAANLGDGSDIDPVERCASDGPLSLRKPSAGSEAALSRELAGCDHACGQGAAPVQVRKALSEDGSGEAGSRRGHVRATRELSAQNRAPGQQIRCGEPIFDLSREWTSSRNEEQPSYPESYDHSTTASLRSSSLNSMGSVLGLALTSADTGDRTTQIITGRRSGRSTLVDGGHAGDCCSALLDQCLAESATERWGASSIGLASALIPAAREHIVVDRLVSHAGQAVLPAGRGAATASGSKVEVSLRTSGRGCGQAAEKISAPLPQRHVHGSWLDNVCMAHSDPVSCRQSGGPLGGEPTRFLSEGMNVDSCRAGVFSRDRLGHELSRGLTFQPGSASASDSATDYGPGSSTSQYSLWGDGGPPQQIGTTSGSTFAVSSVDSITWTNGGLTTRSTGRCGAFVRGRSRSEREARPDAHNCMKGLSAQALAECLRGRHGQSREQAVSVVGAQANAKQVDGETDDSPTVVLGMWFKAAKSDPGRFLPTAGSCTM